MTVEGRADAFGYFGKLLQAEHRFFQDDKCGDITFSWFDSYDGQVSASKSIRLEKASVLSVLYNAAAMSAQLAAMEDYSTPAGRMPPPNTSNMPGASCSTSEKKTSSSLPFLPTRRDHRSTRSPS